ncbi:MAG: hypothetical protein HY209_02930 [Candidatus Omnitrophica bacterium]|nr:hypothetical protein [Candidatus Omnitrophota bacterium]
MKTQAHEPITIDEPMVLVPAEEYDLLIKEAGYRPTPHLSRQIKKAKENFRKGKSLPWRKVRDELLSR